MPVLVNPSRFGTAAPSASFVDTVTALSPSAWYRLGEASGTTMVDSSGNGHDGTYGQGGALAPTLGVTGLVAGDSDTAAAFGGTGAAVTNGTVPYAAWLDAPTSLSLFVIGQTTSSAIMAMLDRDDGTGGRVWQFRLNAGKFEFLKIPTTVTASTPGTYNDGVTHDFGATYDGSNIRLYVDGALVKTQAASGSLGSAGAAFWVGARIAANSSHLFFFGTLDEVLVKSGTVWADSDFADLHAARI